MDHPPEYHGNSIPLELVDVDVVSVVEDAGGSDAVSKPHVVVAAADTDTKLRFAAVDNTSDEKNRGQDSEDDCCACAGHIDKRHPVDVSTSTGDADDGGRREGAWDTALNEPELPSFVVDQDDSPPLDLLST